MNIQQIGTGEPDYNPGPARVHAYADNNGLSPDDLAALTRDGADQLKGYHIGSARAQPSPSHRMSLHQIVDEMDGERAAAKAVELAHDAVSEAARVCKHAGLDGQAVKNELLRASAALIHLLQVIEGN